MSNKIKLKKIETLSNGIIRLQSQLCVGKDTADFILEGGILKNYSNGENGFDFYQIKLDYKIIE